MVMKITALTQEQQEVKALLEEGKSNREIARILWNIGSRESLIRGWIKKGLLTAPENITEEDVETMEDFSSTEAFVAIEKGVNDLTDENIPTVENDATLEELCNSDEWAISNLAKRLRASQRTNNQLRKVQRELFDGKDEKPFDLENVITTALTRHKVCLQPNIETPVILTNKTVEILFSDLQIGKISESWNTEVAIRTLKYYGEEVLKIVKDVNPERIIFCSLGDICECMLKHGIQSAVSTDSSNAEQMANAIEHIWWSVLEPLISLGIPMEIVGVQGNHLSSEGKGMDMFKAGRYGYDYVMYKTWENMCKVVGATHVKFNIPEGHFTTYTIYGKLTVAEHGYCCKGSSEVAMIALRNKRSTNLQQYVHRLVMGDLHHYCNYDNGNLQINSAFFGVAFDAIEYSGIMGFHAVPAQIVNIHEPVTGVGQNTVLETKVIQVAKGYNYGL